MASAAQPNLSSRFWRLVKNGDTHSEYLDDPVKLIGAIVGLSVEQGVSLTWLERLLQNPANAAAAHVRSARNPSGRVKLADVRRWYERSSGGQQQQWDRDGWHAQLWELQQSATGMQWPMWFRVERPRLKGSDVRRVFAAHVQLARESSGIDYPASERKVAEVAQVSDPLARYATRYLVDAKVLRRRKAPKKDGPFTACWYRIDASGSALCRLLGDAQADPELAELAQLERHPAWRHGGVGRFDVWAQVVAGDGQATARSITDDIDAAPATVRRVLAKLAAAKLVERLDDGTYRVLSDDHRAALDAAALHSGMVDRAQRQRERHEADRRAHVETVLRTPRLLAAALHRGVRRVVERFREACGVDPETGEVVAVPEQWAGQLQSIQSRVQQANAPPMAVTV